MMDERCDESPDGYHCPWWYDGNRACRWCGCDCMDGCPDGECCRDDGASDYEERMEERRQMGLF